MHGIKASLASDLLLSEIPLYILLIPHVFLLLPICLTLSLSLSSPLLVAFQSLICSRFGHRIRTEISCTMRVKTIWAVLGCLPEISSRRRRRPHCNFKTFLKSNGGNKKVKMSRAAISSLRIKYTVFVRDLLIASSFRPFPSIISLAMHYAITCRRYRINILNFSRTRSSYSFFRRSIL